MKTVISHAKLRIAFLALIMACSWPASLFAAPEAGTPKAEQFISKININSASAEEIAAELVGIGPKKAAAVVAYREQHGAFTSLQQLLEVQGIGEATLEKNADRITL